MAFAVATVLFATQVYTVSPPAEVSWPQNSTESTLVCTGVSSLINWYVCTTGLPTAEQVMLIMSPLQMFLLVLSTVNTNFSGLTKEENRNNICNKINFLVEGSYFLQIFKTIILCKCLACFYNNILFERSSYCWKTFFEPWLFHENQEKNWILDL